MLRRYRSKRVMDEKHTRLSELVIGSVDTLLGTEMDQLVPAEWNCDPPLLLKVQRPRVKDQPSAEEMEALLKGMLRLGVPSVLRCAVWLSNVIQAVHPEQTFDQWIEYRTLSKVRALDGAYDHILQQIMACEPKESLTPSDIKNYDWNIFDVSTYGRNHDAPIIEGTLPSGELALRRVLLSLDRVVGTDYAPLIPSITSVLLTCMSESYTFCAVREMTHQSARWYFPIGHREHNAWCRAFEDIMKKLHPSTAEYLYDRGVFDEGGLAPIFEYFFIDLVPIKYVQRIMDLYTLEGSKVLFRFGIALLVMYKIESAEQLITISKADEWWQTMKHWTHNPKRFDFDTVVRKAYGLHGKGLRRMMKFPRRSIIQRLIRLEEHNLKYEKDEDSQDGDVYVQPLGLVVRTHDAEGNALVQPVLAQSVTTRTLLAKWLPITLRLNNLDLLYSTNSHGRTLERFYSHVRNSKHTVLICEVLNKASEQPIILGMYASQAWRASPKVYGDGGVFLFRLQPTAACWKWHPGKPKGNLIDNVDFEDESTGDSTTNQTALLEQFMVSTTQFISMGGNPDGSNGLRINEDLTKGESSTATGFDNEPLHGLGKGSVFEIGLLEVYGFVRQIDGRPI